MKTQAQALLIWLHWMVLISAVQAQSVSEPAPLPWIPMYKTRVQLVGEKKQQSGVLFAVTDSTLVLVPSEGLMATLQTIANQHGGAFPPFDSLSSVLAMRTYRYDTIKRLMIHQRGAGAKGLLFGMLAAVGTGLALGDDSKGIIQISAGEKILALSVLTMPVGALISAIVSDKTVIGKRPPTAAEVQRRLRKYAIMDRLKASMRT
jgi:hypothetical protein